LSGNHTLITVEAHEHFAYAKDRLDEKDGEVGTQMSLENR
jgi:hypothetical protein